MGLKNVNTQSWAVATTDPALKVTQTGDGFAADFDGAVAATVVGGARDILSQAVWWVDAQQHDGGQVVRNLGWGGSVLNATAGSGSGVDANDPAWLSWTGTNYVYVPGVVSNGLSVPDANNLDITGDIDVRWYGSLDDWTPASANFLCGKWTGASNQSWLLRVTTTGTLQFNWTTGGSTATNNFATSTVATGIADGVAKWIRVALDVDNGAGQYEVKFYLSDDGATWTQLGSTVTGTTGTTSIYSGTAQVEIGVADSLTLVMTGKVYRCQVLNGINGTPVLDVDTSVITSGSQTQFVARTGQIVSVNRSTSGRKSVCVVEPCWLFGTDDYMEVADNDLLDFGASDSFTILSIVRGWATFNDDTLIGKANTTASTILGYALYIDSTQIPQGRYGDGTNRQIVASSTTANTGALTTYAMVRNVASDSAAFYVNTSASAPVTDTTTGTIANGNKFAVGRLDGTGANYADMEFVAAAVFRRALTASEIAKVSAYYARRGPSYGQDHVIQGDLVVTGAFGYGTGAGGTVTQATSKATGVTLNRPTGQITMNNAALNADTTVSFTLTNSQIAATDLVLVQHVSGGTLGSYTCTATAAAGSATVYVRNVTAGNLSEAIVLQFAVVKAVTA